LFSWVKYANYNGQVNISNRLCDEWVLTLPSSEVLTLDVLHSNNSIPVRAIFPGSSETTSPIFLFSSDLVPGPFPDDPGVLTPDPSCYGNGTICGPSQEFPNPTQVMDFYLFHAANDFVISNTNVADLLGDTFFVCFALLSDSFPYFQWISWWNVNTNTSWGKYAFCNFGSCAGGNQWLVGREAAGSLSEDGMAGQCSDNSATVGSWYSLEQESMCAQGAQVGDQGCAWQIVQRIKTINSSCLFDSQQNGGFENACQQGIEKGDLSVPYQMFSAAFTSDDPNNGGCPPLDGPFAASKDWASTSNNKHTPRNQRSIHFENFRTFMSHLSNTLKQYEKK